MYTFKQYLNEIFDNPSPWKWDKTQSEEYFVARFKHKEDNMKITFIKEEDEWEVVFYRNNRAKQINSGGGEFEVFATIIDIFKDFVKKIKPKKIIYGAIGATRIRLYRRFSQHAAKMFNMTYVEISGETHPSSDSYFVLTKK